MSEANKKTAEIGSGRAGPGRPKGAQNKLTKDVKAMILGALEKAGGERYLLKQSSENPTAFMTLVGKVLPLTLANDPKNPLLLPPAQLSEAALLEIASQGKDGKDG